MDFQQYVKSTQFEYTHCTVYIADMSSMSYLRQDTTILS